MEDKYIVKIKDKDFITYNGLLNEAHSKGLKKLTLVDINVDWGLKTAFCVVRAVFEDKEFVGVGSGTPQNVSGMVAGHFVEMAHTRAKARALRDALNIDMVAFEELGEGEKKEEKKDKVGAILNCISCGAEITQRVEVYSIQHHGKALCMDCQKKDKVKKDKVKKEKGDSK